MSEKWLWPCKTLYTNWKINVILATSICAAALQLTLILEWFLFVLAALWMRYQNHIMCLPIVQAHLCLIVWHSRNGSTLDNAHPSKHTKHKCFLVVGNFSRALARYLEYLHKSDECCFHIFHFLFKLASWLWRIYIERISIIAFCLLFFVLQM